MTTNFNEMILSMRPQKMRTIALAGATDPNAIAATVTAHEMGFVNAILCGVKSEIQNIADKNNLDISDFEIIDCADEVSIAQTAGSLVSMPIRSLVKNIFVSWTMTFLTSVADGFSFFHLSLETPDPSTRISSFRGMVPYIFPYSSTSSLLLKRMTLNS